MGKNTLRKIENAAAILALGLCLGWLLFCGVLFASSAAMSGGTQAGTVAVACFVAGCLAVLAFAAAKGSEKSVG